MQPMNLTFKIEHIIPELKSMTGQQAIGELVEHLVSVGSIPVDTAQSIAGAIWQRENSMSTGLGFGVAIPHAATALVDETFAAFGRSRAGIDFNSVDGQPVRLVVLLVIPARDKENRFLTLARISRLLHRKDIRVALEGALDRASISEILNATQLLPACP
jgi:mannitol/fructose-specific phosphotransferase system IIA component (Ntr-type)